MEAAIERNEVLYRELESIGGRYTLPEKWYLSLNQNQFYQDLLRQIVEILTRKDADENNLCQAWPEVYEIRKNGIPPTTTSSQLEELHQELHDRYELVKQIKREGNVRAGIDMSKEALKELYEKHRLVTEIRQHGWTHTGVSIEWSLEQLKVFSEHALEACGFY
ncbi:hypothetical protein BJY01DRAFT_256210 [Aspergillus pseudoustus]|uniref:Uncharacterized protein n=1 Tax=Aspergillus pseudoustus TaxID=1810923 RepID=A0ABR4IEI1_9EURO